MKAFRAPLEELGGFDDLLKAFRRGSGMIQVKGCIDSQKVHFIDGLTQKDALRCIVAPNELRAREIYENYKLFDRNVMLFPAKDFIFFQADVRSSHLTRERISVLSALAEGKCTTLVTTQTAFMNRMMPARDWKDQALAIRPGDQFDLDEWKERLLRMGYERTSQVEEGGQFAVRGGIIDIFPMTEENPFRIELWGDEVDSIRSVDAASQRSIENLDEAMIYPACELIAEPENVRAGLEKLSKEAAKAQKHFKDTGKYEEARRVKAIKEDADEAASEFGNVSRMENLIAYFCPDTVSLLDYIPSDAPIILDEPNRMEAAALEALDEFKESMTHRLEKGYVLPSQTGLLYGWNETAGALSSRRCVGLTSIESIRGSWNITYKYDVDVRSVNSYQGSFELLVKDLERWKKDKYRVILPAASHARGTRLVGDLQERGLNAFFSEDEDVTLVPGQILVTYGNISRGYEYPLIRFVVISESDIFGREKQRRKKRRFAYEGTRINSYTELDPGDYVIHENHGLGIYRGIEKIETDHVIKDYIKIEYADGGNLYVQASALDMVSKYADADSGQHKLNRLGGQQWEKTKTRVRGAVKDIAAELVMLYAERQEKQGYVYGEDTVWQTEFEEMFPFEETEDQLKAIEETKKDMMSPKIMDRLICGDVGYGKTEVALRAAFKAVQEGKQVAYLVPTTILAQQHYNTFVQRMKDFPVRVDLMCRFRTNAEQKKTVEDLKKGLVDVVIGTHRLLSKDVEFKNLGLLVVDEEQRFGVTHKEKIKQMKKDVDVLTLTATPIPRTLHMSLVGIRDMSVLEEAPQDRLPIQTFVMEYNEETVREAISREIARGGQVYYVYNRVSSIADITAKIAALVPQATVSFAHGQMHERELEEIMYDFINGDIDVLVSTTIIETGLDIPNVNTMIIHSAEKMGLSQLYQLRGRIGRSNRTAYAFLMYKKDQMLKETAEKRLSAIREFTELGSGIRIAMRDLEIRGAGNLLGSEQSGHMEAVGYDLYCKLLAEAVKEEKGIKSEPDSFETSIDLDMDAYIPASYIRSEEQKLDIYRRIALVSNEEEMDDLSDELMDRFGELPHPVRNLLNIAFLKSLAHSDYLTGVVSRGDEIRFIYYEKARIDVGLINDFAKRYHDQMVFRTGKETGFVYTRKAPGQKKIPPEQDLLRVTREILEDLESLKLPGTL